MNIAIDIRPLMSSMRTGVGEYTYELLNALFKLDRSNQYYLFYNSRRDVSANIPKWQYDNVHLISTRWPNKIFNFALKFLHLPKLDKLISKNAGVKIDLFFSPNINFTALSKQVKSLLTIHDLSFVIYPEFFSGKRRLWHKIIQPAVQCRQADMVITPSVSTKQDVIQYYKIPQNKVKVIYPGLPTISPTEGQEPDSKDNVKKKYDLPEKFILFLGTVEPRKNISTLINAFEHAFSRLPMPHYLVIAGAKGWKNKKIYQQAQKSKHKDKIKFIGYVDKQDKPIIYSLTSLFIYPSFYEGFGFPVLEAMHQNKAVITSNRSSMSEISQPAAYLVNPNKTSEISQGIVKILENDKLKEYLGQLGRAQVEKFNWQTAARQWLELIKQLD